MPRKSASTAQAYLADLKVQRAATARRLDELSALIASIERIEASPTNLPAPPPGAPGNDGRAGHSTRYHGKRTSDGMHAAKKRGKRLGAPLFMDEARIKEAAQRIKAGESVAQIAESWGKSRQTIYKHFSKEDVRRLREEGLAETADIRPELRLVR